MDKNKFARYTEKIRLNLPFWFKLKKKPRQASGLDFLDIFGMQLDDIEDMLEYASRQYYIDSADEHFVDLIYKVILPSQFNIKEISMVYSDKAVLDRAFDLYTFFGLEKNIKKLDNDITQPDYYFLDTDRKILYVREAYEKDNELPFGKIRILYQEKEIDFELSLHHVWNFFDEFGALLGCPRLYGEKNHYYKQRILDVFKNPANSTKRGLANGIARELGIREIKLWKDMSEDIILTEKMIIVNTISVNGTLVSEDNIFTTKEGYIALKGIPDKKDKSCEVSFIKGLEMYQLIDKKHPKLNIELYDDKGMPTETLLKYIECIKEDSSILWGDFKYNEAMWVDEDEEYYNNQYSFKPTLMDANIKGFAKYGYFRP